MIFNLKILKSNKRILKALETNDPDERVKHLEAAIKIVNEGKTVKTAKVTSPKSVYSNGVDIEVLQEVGLVLPFEANGIPYGLTIPEPLKLKSKGIEIVSYSEKDILLRGNNKIKQDKLLLDICRKMNILKGKLGYASYSLSEFVYKVLADQKIAKKFGLEYLWFFTGSISKGNYDLANYSKEKDVIIPKNANASKDKVFVYRDTDGDVHVSSADGGYSLLVSAFVAQLKRLP